MAGRKKSEVGKPETEAEKFVRLAEQRVGMALKYIGLVGNLGAPGYEKTGEQVAEIGKAMQDAIDTAMDRLKGKPQSAVGFRLAKSTK